MERPDTMRVDLDESRVVAVSRDAGRVVIELLQQRGGETRRIEVLVADVSKEVAEHYVGHNITAAHPSPEFPLDCIEYAEQGPAHLELQGYLQNDCWYLWRIEGKDIQILYRSAAADQ
jgi:hypothetical protein